MNFATVMGGSTVGTTMGNPIVKTLALCFCRDGKADKLASSKRWSCPGFANTETAALGLPSVGPELGNKIMSAKEPASVISMRPTHVTVSILDDHSKVNTWTTQITYQTKQLKVEKLQTTVQ